MELETLFTTSKWDILGKISRTPLSPLQLSNQLSTTIANISQQMRLLDVAGLLDKEKISTRESGKPRTLFSVKNDFSYLILVSAEGAKKGLIEVGPGKRLIMRAWLTKDKVLESIAFRIHEQLGDQLDMVTGIVRNRQRKELIIASDEHKSLSKAEDRLIKELDELGTKVRLVSTKDFLSQMKGHDASKLSDTFDILLLEQNTSTELQKEG